MEQQPHRTCDQKKPKPKQNQIMSHSRDSLFDLANKQCNGIIKGWLHFLTSESNGRFLVNNILIFGSAWFNPIQFSLIKKIKVERLEQSLTPHPTPYVR